METRREPQPLHNPPPVPMAQQMPLRVNPNYPLPSSLPPSQSMDQSHLPETAQGSGVARTTSQRRRQVSGRSQGESTRQPTAPQAPKPPPVSYRDPYGNGVVNSPTANSTSFAARVRAAPPDSISARIPNKGFDPVIHSTTPSRRGINSRPPGGLYAAVQSFQSSNRAPISSPTTGPSSPPHSSNNTTPRQYQPPDAKPPQPASDQTKPAKTYDDTAYPVPRSKSRRVSAGAAESPTEWAADRSPLQKLEVKLNDISKEEKRARVEEAEQLLRESNAGSRPRRSSQEIESTSHRRQSRRASAGTDGKSRSALPGEAREAQKEAVVREDRGVSSRNRQPEPLGAKTASQPEKLQNSPRNEIHVHSNSTRIPAASRLPVGRDRTRPVSGGPLEAVESGQLSGKGVRFQSQRPPNEPGLTSGVGSEPLSRPSGTSRVEESGFGASASGARAISQQDRLPRDQPVMGNKASKQLSSQPHSLRNRNVESSRNNALPASDRGAANSVSTKTVPSSNDGLKYDELPKPAAGMDTQKKNEVKTSPNGVTENPVHRKHHLSGILHRSRQHEPVPDETSTSRSRPLDEWRRAGTARLTIADMSPRNDTATGQIAWWEGRASNSGHSKSRKSRETKSLDGGYEDNYGKSSFSSSLQDTSIERSPGSHPGLGAAHLRRYVANDELQEGMQRDHSGLRGHLFHTRADRQLDLFSVYSYSCPHLDEHNDSHPYHICKPYVSKELTRSMRSIRIRAAPPTASFTPPLYLKCGPLLRYTGLKKEMRHNSGGVGSKSNSERETWRGSVMIVTVDADSAYTPTPVLRLFPEPIDLLPPPPQQVDDGSGNSLPHEYIDPIAGLPKLSRTGKTVYVKPVEDLDVQVDLSRVEDDAGLFEETRTAAVPTSYGQPNNRPRRDVSSASTGGRTGRGEKDDSTKYQQTKGVRLHAERGVTFWRFNIEVELGERQVRIAYRINNSASVGFWVPARGQTMNVMFHSCNGFSMSVDPNQFSGPDPLWRDVLNSHQTRPFHVMIGGGDQIYNDAVMSQTTLFHEWLGIKNPHHKHEVEFSHQMQEELETFYLERYCMWFSQGLFGMANSQIPMVNIWDDHDIIDGFGSYPDHFMRSPVFSGLGAVAFKYYMLFQHQSIVDEGMADEPSWLLGATPGPYINELSRSVFMFLGKHVAFLGLDCRTERKRNEILSEASYSLAFDRCRREIVQGETKHLIVLLGVPIAYPRLVWLENLLTSKVMDPVKALGRAGILGNFLNKFDGGVEILDDLDDHWTSKNHKMERNWLIQELQELAAEKSVRVTILGGDVHLAAVGQFYSNPKLKVPKDHDHRYMANIISSAIVNTPPPEMMGDILNKRNKIHHLDQETDEDMIPMFTHDVDMKSRHNKRLLPRRNWCSIREYHPGTTPPPTPPLSEPQTPSDHPPRPANRLQRTLSLTRNDVKPGNLFRRLSQRGPPPSMDYPPSNQYRASPPASASPPPHSQADEDYFVVRRRTEASSAGGKNDVPVRRSSAPLPRPGNFHRRPTNMSEKAATKGDAGETHGHINLENGLDIVINCEVSQKDPAGITVPYRLLIPTLWYEGGGDQNEAVYRKKSWISRLGSISKGGSRKSALAKGQGGGEWGGSYSGESGSESISESEREHLKREEVRYVRRSGDLDDAHVLAPKPSKVNQGESSGVRRDEAQHTHGGRGPTRDAYLAERRASKVDDMLGMAGPAEGRVKSDGARFGNGNGNGNAKPNLNLNSNPDARAAAPRYEDDAEGYASAEEGVGRKRGSVMGRGYGGIEAYKESKWRRFF